MRARLIVYGLLGALLCASLALSAVMREEQVSGTGDAAASLTSSVAQSWMTPQLTGAIVTLLLALAAALGHYGPKQVNRIRYSNGRNRRGEGERTPCNLSERFVAESREFQSANIHAMERMCEAASEQTQTLKALSKLALALARQAKIDTSLSPLDSGDRP